MANIITELHLEMSSNWYVSKKLNSIGRVGENTVTKLIIEPTEILNNVTYELEIMSADGSKNVAELTIEGSELYLILTANMLAANGITKMQVRGLFADGSIKKSNIFELKVNRSISATEAYEEYAVTIFDQLVQDCRDIIEGAESYAVRAETAATNAEAYEQSASASAQVASASASTASTASTAAVNAAASAESASTSAHTSAETATTAAASASASATTATTASENAQTAASTATTASTTAVNASTTATTAATNAETAANTATTAASNASASATSAASSATAASTSATNASASAVNAATSETNAANSATSASTAASNANTSATNAANSATSAAASATNAHTSEVNASTSETNASTSAAEAEASAESIAASVSQINENTYRINDLEAIIAGYQEADLPTGAVATVTDGTALLMPSLKIGIEPVQEGSGDPSPDNIRPIEGWDECNVTRSGKNLWNTDDIASISVGATAIRNGLYFRKPGQYTVSAQNSGNYLYCRVLNADGTIKATYFIVSLATITNTTFTISDGEYFAVYDALEGTIALSKSRFNSWLCQVELGSTATTYEPYTGQTYNVQFTDGTNPLTVYGGTLDVTSGELVVDRGSVDLGTLNWSTASTGRHIVGKPTDIKIVPNTTAMNGVCSQYILVSGNASATTDSSICMLNGSLLQINDSNLNGTDAESFKTAMNGVQLVYELAEPITYQLTPTQVRTLVGNNNIWTDTGDIIEGKYFKSLS